jgi:transcription-repair coupling factor (superfamily II helicase)
VETDWEAYIPDKYVTSNPERLNLYMQLDRIETEEGLVRFSTELEDRFGPIPEQVTRLLDVVRVRKTAQGLGIEKLLLKRGTMRATFTSRRTEAFFASDVFERVLHFVQANPNRTQLKESKAGAQLQVESVTTGDDAIRTLAAMGGIMQEE